MFRATYLLLLFLLPINALAADSYSVNFIIPIETPTPIQNQGIGGGGGNPQTYKDISPPALRVKILSIQPPEAHLAIEITNEGSRDWEYVYSWTLNHLNTTGATYEQVDTWQASKFVKKGETVSIPLSFYNLTDGTYALKVDVNYDEYTSKASVNFKIGQGKSINLGDIIGNQQSISSGAVLVSVAVLVSGAVAYFKWGRKPKKHTTKQQIVVHKVK